MNVTIHTYENWSRKILGEMASIFQKRVRLPADADLMQARGKKIYVQENKRKAADKNGNDSM